MAFRLKRADGQCCGCEELVDPCHCTEPLSLGCRHAAGSYTLAIALSCSTRTGEATLVGCSAFTAPSTPPKKYRRATHAGSVGGCNYTNSGCSGGNQFRLDRSGALIFDVATGVSSSTAKEDIFTGSGCPAAVTLNSTQNFGACAGAFAANSQYTATSTATTTTRTARAGCVADAFVPGLYVDATGSHTITLSSEDTEADARARSTPSAWGSFAACGGLPCCEAYATTRGAGVFTFSYQDARLKADYGGMGAGLGFTLSVEVDYAPVGGGTLAFYTTLDAALTADGSGAGTHTFTLPDPPSGYSFFAVDYVVELTAAPSAPETWGACTEVADDWAGQSFDRASGVLTYNFAQRRAKWITPAVGVTRTVRFTWERTVYGAGAWSDYGHTDASVTGLAGPAESWTDWVDVPNEVGYQTRLKEARMLPP